MHSLLSSILLASAAVGTIVPPVWLGVNNDTTVDDAGAPSQKRSPSDYKLIFNGTGTSSNDRDASIEGTEFLTYTVVPNSTYNVDACLDFCDRINNCIFVNLFYEFNNVLLDFVFREKSNLKCTAYAAVHSAAEKTNFGGQQSYPSPGPLTYIRKSSGYAQANPGGRCRPAESQGYGSVQANRALEISDP